MKKWLIPVVGLIVAFATAGTAAGLTLTGGGSDAAEQPESEGPASSAVCAEGVPNCNDMLEPSSDDGELGPAPNEPGNVP